MMTRGIKFVSLLLALFVSFSAAAQSVGLVMSGGGAKGLSHIGVIKALEEHNIPIDYVGGTSMGAIVAGLYSIGLTPEEMILIIKSDRFLSWYKGEQERDFASFIYRVEPTPSMMRVNIRQDVDKNGEKSLKLSLPTSIVKPYPMDLAVVQLFGTSSAAADYDFKNLMVPFFCVAADITNKKPYVATKGDLGSAIRASMTFPAYFKPITIDSLLLFDGGFYNNFPWELMEEIYTPDFIIGSKCVKGEAMDPDDDDPIGMLEMMITTDTDYNIPEDNGVVIAGEYNAGLMDFHKVDEIVEQGYQKALEFIPELKERIGREISADELSDKRLSFRKRCPELKFKDIVIEGDLSEDEKEYIDHTISDGRDTFTFIQGKRGYYKVAASNTVNTFYPTSRFDKSDSLFTLNIQTTKKMGVTLEVGGNISTSSLMQGYIGGYYRSMGKHPSFASLGLNIGQYYTGANITYKKDLTFKPLFFTEVELVSHRFDYLLSSQSLLFSNSLARNVQELESYATLSFGIPVSAKRGMIMTVGATAGTNNYFYFPTKNYTKYDKQDHSNFMYVTPRVKFEQNTLNYRLYPTEGKYRSFEFRYIYGKESYKQGTYSYDYMWPDGYTPHKHSFSVSLLVDNYYSLAKWFTLGLNAQVTFSKRLEMVDYTSTLLATPAYYPNVHSTTLLMEKYRSPFFAGVTLSPIFKFSSSIALHSSVGIYQPYRKIIEEAGGKYTFSDPFPRGYLHGSLALVWQSPFGPLSVSCAYYSCEETKFYPQINLGFLIFKERGLRN